MMFRLVVMLAFVFAVLGASPALAQVIAPGGEVTTEQQVVAEPSPNDVAEFMRLLADPSMRAWLERAANDTGAAAEQPAGWSPGAEVDRQLALLSDRAGDLVAALALLPQAPSILAQIWAEGLAPGDSLRALVYCLVFLFVGGGLEWLFWQYVGPLSIRIESSRPPTLWLKVLASASRMGLSIAGLVIFSVGAIGTFLFFQWPAAVRALVINLLFAIVLARTLVTLLTFVLAPRVAALRLVPLGTEFAKRLFRWAVSVGLIAIIGAAVSDTFMRLAALPTGIENAPRAALALSLASSTLITLAVLFMIARLAPAFAASESTARIRLGPLFLGLITVFVYVLWLLGARELMWTVVIIGLLAPLLHLANWFVGHVHDSWLREAGNPDPAGIDGETGHEGDLEDPEDEALPDVWFPIVLRFIRFIFVGTAIIALGFAWGIDFATLSGSQTAGGHAFRVMLMVVLTVLVADLIWLWAKTVIDRKLAEYGDLAANDGMAPGPGARVATLLPILRMFIMIVVIVLVTMTVLASIGVNIAPLIAGAGVVGIAIGFGAQALVRDVVSGIFFLLDDAFRVGEYIEMDNLRGTVESMSLRSLRVRHHRGAVHTIPFGELKAVSNYSRDWVIMKLEFRVPFDTDIALVKKIVKRIGKELSENENYGKFIIEPLKSQGVRRMEEFNMVVGVKFTAQPGAQWVIRRDAYQKLRDAFDENGISFASRDVKVEVLGGDPNSPEAREAALAAAQQATEQALPAPGAAPDEP